MKSINQKPNIRNIYKWHFIAIHQSVICLLVVFIGLNCQASANNNLQWRQDDNASTNPTNYMLNLIEDQAVDSTIRGGDTIYHFEQVENVAEYSGGQIAFLRDFNKAFDLSGIDERDYRTKIIAECIVTADGFLIEPRIFDKDLTTIKSVKDYTPFGYAIIHALLKLNNGKWKAATKDKKSVSSYYKFLINIDYQK